MVAESKIKQQVREFYDQVGWQEVSDGIYQNARYEDLRPVSREYIQRCHKRIKHHLDPKGHLMLDAGSGPIQYPEYIEYSQDYEYRVCADISIKALLEARKRIENHGLFVVADIARLPFLPNVFDGAVSLHTIHHLPIDEHAQAYNELYRVLKMDHSAVIVNGWHQPPLGEFLKKLRKITLRIQGLIKYRILRRKQENYSERQTDSDQKEPKAKSTFVAKNTPSWFRKEIGTLMPHQIFVWRSISVKDLRTFAHDGWGGRRILRALFWLEDLFPHWFGENGQYPMVVIRKA